MSEDHKKRCNFCDKAFERNNYYFGKLMKARDFKTEQSYFNEKRWLINRMIHGWGVVWGLDIEHTNNPNEVRIKPGLAIDCCGREILVCKPQTISLIPEAEECSNEMNAYQTNKREPYAICLRYKECKTEHFPIMYSVCDQKEKCQYNHIRDWFEIKIVPFSPPPGGKHFCPRRYGCKDNNETHYHCTSLHQCICDLLCKCDLPECPENSCIILATYTLGSNYEIENINQYPDKEIGEEFDKYSARRLIYSNPLLYDLISCYHGDLPRVCNTNWEHNKLVEWKDLHDLVTKGLRVTFNKPMNSDTINTHTFQVAAIAVEERTGYRLFRYIPADNVVVNKDATEATFIFEKHWIEDEVWDKSDYAPHSGLADGAEFEITLRGSSIFSEDGRALDGCFKGDLPSGTGTQGSDFVSWFSVEARRYETQKSGHQ